MTLHRLFHVLFLIAAVPPAVLFSQTKPLNMSMQMQPAPLRINRIDPNPGLPGKPVTIYYSFVGTAADVMRMGKLTFNGSPAKCSVESSGILTAYVPLDLRANEPIAVVLTVGKLSSPPFTSFSVAWVRPDTIGTQYIKYRIENVRPVSVAPGDTVEIITKPTIRIGASVFLKVNGRSAETSYERGRLTARIPMDSETDSQAKLELTVNKNQAEPFFGLHVLPRPLRILSITPNPAKRNDTLHIFVQPPYPMRPAAEWAVWFDSLRGGVLAVDPEKFGVLVTIPDGLVSLSPRVILAAAGQVSEPFGSFAIERSSSNVLLVVVGGVFLIGLLVAAIFLRNRAKDAKAISHAQSLGTEQGISRREAEVSYPLPAIPPELIDCCVNRECVLYAGAGLSEEAGFPTWKEFVDGLLVAATEKRIIDDHLAGSLRAALDEGQTDAVADSLVSALKTHGEFLEAYLRTTFLRPQAQLPPTHSVIKDLGLAGALTTNFDDLLERTYSGSNPNVFTPGDAERLGESLTKRNFFILKLYGIIERPTTLLVSPEQYLDAMAKNLPFTKFMETLFFSRTLLFLGASLEGLEDYMKGITFREYQGRPHFALVNLSGTGWLARADSLSRRYGIRVLPYTATDGFPEVLSFLENLREALKQRASDQGFTSSKKGDSVFRASPLKKVQLHNIGPFTDLELRLDPDLNVLLGDNGVGKSTILKAIALGICGKDGEPDAGRLINVDQTSARIILETERNQYTTELFKTTSGAEIVLRSARPLEAEGWLAIGFPPLRSASSENPKPPQSWGISVPVSDDLLPLLRGGVDMRMQKLKQWLVDLDYMIEKESKDAKGQNKFTRMRHKLFEIVEVMTPGLKIEPGPIDPKTKQISIVTDDGVVPIESASQGTTSLVSWIGVLVQRLYEVYGDEEDPINRYSLVLIDEIDAHMHPSWQQSLVKHLRDIFPNTQFVCTTHSPLIVSGVGRDQVKLFYRKEQTQHVMMREIESDFRGLRADQILTSGLFNLASSGDGSRNEMINRYLALSELTTLSPEQVKELSVLKQRLQKVLSFGETEYESELQEAVKQTLADRRKSKSAETGKPPMELTDSEKLTLKAYLADILAEEGPRK